MSSSYSSLDCVLSRWVHFTVHRFICVYLSLCVCVCVFVFFVNWRAIDKRWNRNTVSLVSSVTAVMHLPVYYCRSCNTITDVKSSSASNVRVIGGYTSDHQVIVMFWRVIENFTDTERRQLLKFVTSCSRPPLLGFKVSPLTLGSHESAFS